MKVYRLSFKSELNTFNSFTLSEFKCSAYLGMDHGEYGIVGVLDFGWNEFKVYVENTEDFSCFLLNHSDIIDTLREI